MNFIRMKSVIKALASLMRSQGGKIVITLGFAFAYLVAYFPLYSWIGPGIAALSVVPVAVAAWLLGLRIGFLAGLLTLLINTLLLNLVGYQPGGWDVGIRGGAGPGFAAIVLIGVVVGRLSDLSRRVRLELVEREKAEKGLVASKAQFQELFKNVPVGVYQSTPESKFLTVNPTLVRMLGYDSEAELLSIDIERDIYVNPTAREAWKRKLEEEGELPNFEETFKRKDGQEIIVLGNSRAVRDESGEVLFYEGTIIDITERVLVNESLREREEQFRLTFEHAPTGIALATLDGRFLQMNQAYCDILGYSEPELLNQKFSAVTHPDDLDANLLLVEKLLKGEIPHFKMEKHYIHKNGKIVPVILQVCLVREPQGQPLHFIAQVVDITERVQSEENLKLFRNLIDQSNDAIFVIDPKTSLFLDFNKKACTNLGYERQELLSMGVTDIEVVIPDIDSWKNLVARIQEKGQNIIEGNHKRKDGTLFPVEVSAKFITQEKGDYLVAVIRDITERKLAEEALRQSEAEFSRVADSISDYLWSAQIDKNGDFHYLYYSSVVEKITGRPPEYYLKGPENWLETIHPQDRSRLEKLTKRLMSGQLDRKEEEYRIVMPDGTVRWLRDSVVVTRLEDNSIRLDGVVTDITERIRAEEELLKAKKLESVGILAGGIAHDFNNILTSIVGNISFAKISEDSQEVSKILDEVEKASLRAKGLTGQLLTFSKGGAPIKKTASIEDIIRDTSDFVLRGSNVRCEVSMPDDEWFVEVDPDQISQVINNLVLNAQQTMPAGGTIKIGIENITVGAGRMFGLPLEDGKYVKISIEDQGVGIPKKHIQNIFDPFFTTKQKGSGLGLAIAYSTIKNHGGYINSTLDKK